MKSNSIAKAFALAALACSFAAAEARAQEEGDEEEAEQEEVAQPAKKAKSKKEKKAKKSDEDIQKKFNVVIRPFGNKADASAKQFGTLRERIQSRLIGTRRFVVLERGEALEEDVMSEKALADAGYTNDEEGEAQTASKSADFVIYGNVLFFGRDGAAAEGAASTAVSLKMRVELSLKITECKTAEVLADKTVIGYGSSSSITTSGVQKSGNLEEQVARDAADDVARRVVEALREHVYPAKIVKVGKRNVTVNLTDAEAMVDDIYDVFAPAEEEEDPDNDEPLEIDGEYLGRVKIVRTMPKSSVAEPIDDLDIDDLEKGCSVRRVSPETLAKEQKKKKEKAKKQFKSRF